MRKVLLFILVPLTFLAYLTAFGVFESYGGIEKLSKKTGWLSRIVFYPLTYDVPEGWTQDISRVLVIPAAILFFAMSIVRYAQMLCSNTVSKAVSTLFAMMCSGCIYLALAQ
ncbi:hypothetical protein [Microbulbifer sp. YPW16]|uniref:hypothetical protein n=1 Tax=unclassified Microbulbifer TaxID=2619833 RepID=UPI001E5139AA|nr:hypothetical protein [Microbulbifer sp. YPW16]UHQ54586.1 hypothetical protein LVE68_13910 [Microbulbifer sp. YPW16]